jgi:hypothetical protein
MGNPKQSKLEAPAVQQCAALCEASSAIPQGQKKWEERFQRGELCGHRQMLRLWQYLNISHIYIYRSRQHLKRSSDDNLECSRSTFALDFDVRTCWMIRRLWPRGCCKDWARLLQLCCAMLRSVVSEFPVVSPGRRTFPLPFADASLGSKAGGCCDLEKRIKASSMSMHISDIYAQCDNISIYSIFRQTNLQTERQMHVPIWIGQHVIWHTVPYHTIPADVARCKMDWVGGLVDGRGAGVGG